MELPFSLEKIIQANNNNFYRYNFGGYVNVGLLGSTHFGTGIFAGAGYEVKKFYFGIEPNFRFYAREGAGASINTKIAYRF